MTSHALTVVFLGIEAHPIDVQVHIANGLPALNIVGLADKSVSESKERIRAAFSSLGIMLPAKRITINLSPSNLIKEGSHFDLPIALALLHAMEVIDCNLTNYVVLGELSLNGDVKAVNGILASLVLAVKNKKSLVFPISQINEVGLFSARLELIPVNNLNDLINHFKKQHIITMPKLNITSKDKEVANIIDLADIKGQEIAKRSLQVAAAGSHNLLMIGPPGVGKSMLAKALPGILPPLSKKEMLEISLIYSVSGMLKNNYLITNRPFRAPHHTASEVSLIGGGKKGIPGEITLAHKGVLFLDELAEFNSHTLNSLREPLENGVINISRLHNRITFPADFQLIAAMNPCKCGYLGDISKQCSKSPYCGEIYQSKISGPLLDRIDLTVELSELELYNIDNKKSETSENILKNIIKAKEIQNERYKKETFTSNAKMNSKFLELITKEINNNYKARDLLMRFANKFRISMRSYNRIIKIARTISDLEENDTINEHHIAEAISYRKINYNNIIKNETF